MRCDCPVIVTMFVLNNPKEGFSNGRTGELELLSRAILVVVLGAEHNFSFRTSQLSHIEQEDKRIRKRSRADSRLEKKARSQLD